MFVKLTKFSSQYFISEWFLKIPCCFIFKLQDPCLSNFLLHVLCSDICIGIKYSWEHKSEKISRNVKDTDIRHLIPFKSTDTCCAVAKNVSQLETDCCQFYQVHLSFQGHMVLGSIPRQSLYMAVVSQLRSVHKRWGPSTEQSLP